MKIRSRILKARKIRKAQVVSAVSEENILIDSAKSASSKAIRSSKALGLSFKIIMGNKIISVNADQSEKVEREISKSSVDISKLKKGMSLKRK
jgi:hypothetical protein